MDERKGKIFKKLIDNQKSYATLVAGLGYLALIQAKSLSHGAWAQPDVWTLVGLRLAFPIGN